MSRIKKRKHKLPWAVALKKKYRYLIMGEMTLREQISVIGQIKHPEIAIYNGEKLINFVHPIYYNVISRELRSTKSL